MYAYMYVCMRLGNPVRFRNWNDVLDNRTIEVHSVLVVHST